MATVLILTPHERMPQGFFSIWFWWGKENLLQKLGQMSSIQDFSHHVSLKKAEEVHNYLENNLADSSHC